MEASNNHSKTLVLGSVVVVGLHFQKISRSSDNVSVLLGEHIWTRKLTWEFLSPSNWPFFIPLTLSLQALLWPEKLDTVAAQELRLLEALIPSPAMCLGSLLLITLRLEGISVFPPCEVLEYLGIWLRFQAVSTKNISFKQIVNLLLSVLLCVILI